MVEYAKAGALKPLDSVLDSATYKSETAPALVSLGTVDGKLTGVFIKAAVKGLIWYNPKVHDYSAAPPATWTDLMSQATANKGSAQAICASARQWRRLRLAGHRLIGTSSSPVGPQVTTTGGRQTEVLRPDQEPSESPHRRRETSPTRRRGRSDQGLQPDLRSPFANRLAARSSTRPASSPVSAPSRPRRPAPTTTSSRSPTSTPPTPAPLKAPGTCSACSTTPTPRSH